MCARIVFSGMQRCVVKNIYTARRRKAPLPLRFGAFMGRRLNFSAGREYAVAKSRAQTAADALTSRERRNKMLVAKEKIQSLILLQNAKDLLCVRSYTCQQSVVAQLD